VATPTGSGVLTFVIVKFVPLKVILAISGRNTPPAFVSTMLPVRITSNDIPPGNPGAR